MKETRETFFKRLPNLNARQRFLLEFAYDLAKEAHGYIKQMRDGGERYFEHPRHVALILIDEFGITDIKILIPALFHDMPEDVPIWKVPGRITHIFGKTIGGRCNALAKPDKSKMSSDKDSFLKFYMTQVVKSGWETSLIKIADRMHNLRTMNTHWDAERQEKYRVEARTYFQPLVTQVQDHAPSAIARVISDKLNSAISNKSVTI